MTSVASQLIAEVAAYAQSGSLEDAREICADGTSFPNILRTYLIATIAWAQFLLRGDGYLRGNKTGNIHIHTTQRWAYVQIFLPWISSKFYTFVALYTQYALSMRHVSYVACVYVFTLFHKWQGFRKKEKELGEASGIYGGMRRV